MARYFTRSQAAELLGISRRQLYTWLLDFPKSEKGKLSEQDIAALARKHSVTLPAAPAGDTDQGAQIAALQERLAALENSASALSALLQEVLQRIEALERQPAPLDRSMRPGQPDQAPRPVAPAMSPSIDATRPASAPRSASTPAAPAPGASMRSAAPLPPPVRMLVAQWIADHGGPAANTVRRWQDMPLEPAAALRYTQQKIAELGYRAHGAQLHRCQHAQCVCQQVLPE